MTVFSRAAGVDENPKPYPQITYSHQETACIATRHLVSLGYSRIGFIGLKSSPMWTVGFLTVAGADGLLIQAKWILQMASSWSDFEPLGDRLRQILKSPDRPEAFCCAIEGTASKLEGVAADMGITVPEDLAIIACDAGIPETPERVAITTVSMSRQEVCRKVLEVIEQLRSGPGHDNQLIEPIYLPLHLTIRDSCGAKLKATEGVSTQA